MSNLNQTSPLVTIITVVYNGAALIEDTIKSILGQDYPHIEYIVIDGGSKDGTLEIINRYQGRITKIVSEKDKGIYDAMNKGVGLAQGEWINFMNAGDSFISTSTISHIFAKPAELNQSDILVGSCIVEFEDYKILREPGSFDDLWKGTQFCHQATFIRSSAHKSKHYNISNKIVADFEFFFDSYSEGRKLKRIDETIAFYKAGGVSDQKKTEVLKGFFQTVWKKQPSFKTAVFYCFQFLMLFTREGIKNFISPALLKKIRIFRNKKIS